MNENGLTLILCLVLALIMLMHTGYYLSKKRRQRIKMYRDIAAFNDVFKQMMAPLTLIKAPLSDIVGKTKLTESDTTKIDMALKQTDILISMVDRLIHYNDTKFFDGVNDSQFLSVDGGSVELLDNASLEGTGVEDARHILIVENNPDMRSFMLNKLIQNYFVYTAVDGDKGWEILKQVNIDLVISELDLPGTGGDELCALVKNNLSTSHIPVVLISVQDNKPDMLKGYAIGADNYLLKPFDEVMLQAMVSTIFSNRDMLRERFSSFELNGKEASAIEGFSPIDRKFIYEVNGFIESNMSNAEFSVDIICAHVGMSRSSFYNKIKALTSQPPANYVRDLRLIKAAQLLKSREYNITEVADMTGFSDAKYFREVFKKRYNMTPTAFIESGSLEQE
jgi:AraC-like DNA-binding protein/CheY-like chemotaxis protein